MTTKRNERATSRTIGGVKRPVTITQEDAHVIAVVVRGDQVDLAVAVQVVPPSFHAGWYSDLFREQS